MARMMQVATDTRSVAYGSNRKWFTKGQRAARTGRYSDMYAGWHAATGKPGSPGDKTTAQESFYQGFMTLKNPARKLPKGWVRASAVKITRNKGKLEVRIKRR